MLQNSIHNLDDVKKENETKEDLETLMNREEVMWSQKTRCNQIIIGDRNTKYFQTIVKQKKARNLILQLKTEEGVSVEDQGTIENLLVDHFKKSYEGTITTSLEYMLDEIQALPIPQLSSQQNLTLNYPITNWEIESTIFQLGSHKAPGLNGIPTFFIKTIGKQ